MVRVLVRGLTAQRSEDREDDDRPEGDRDDRAPVGFFLVQIADVAMSLEHGQTPFVVQRNRVASAIPPITSAVEIEAREIKKTSAPQTQAQTIEVRSSKPEP